MMCCSPNREAVRAATHYYTRAWQLLIYGKECYIVIVIWGSGWGGGGGGGGSGIHYSLKI